MIHSLCDQWLNLRSLNKVTPSQKLYPENDELLTHYLPLETEATLEHLLRNNLSVDHLVDADFAVINQRLARHYGIAGVVGHELRHVALPPESPRGGLLTMASVLKVTADGFDTSPILRGAWISKRVVGNTLSPPPENVGELKADLSQSTTLKEQIAAHKQAANCQACHKSIDPYGFALENFDAIGQWRSHYRIKKPHQGTFIYRPGGYYELAGQVDASGEIHDRTFKNIFGLKEMLRNDHQQVAYNFAKTFFEYVTGYQPDFAQRIALHRMIPDKATECRLRDLLPIGTFLRTDRKDSMTDLTRRDVLKFGAALPLALGSLQLCAAEKQKQPPQRIIFICNSLGFYEPYFFPQTRGDLGTSRYLKGLRAIEKMTVFQNFFHPGMATSNHDSEKSFLTGCAGAGVAELRQ